MAGKPLNRLDLRRQREAAEPLDPMEDETDEVGEEVEEEEVVEKKPKKKPKAPAEVEGEIVAVGQAGGADAHRVGRAQRCVQAGGDVRLHSERSGRSQGGRIDRQGQRHALRAADQGSDARRRPRHRRRDPQSRHAGTQSLTRQKRRPPRPRSKKRKKSRKKRKTKSKSRNEADDEDESKGRCEADFARPRH